MNKNINENNSVTAAKFMSHELKLRIVSAIVLAIVVLTITWIGGQTFTLLWAVAAFLILIEFNRMCGASMPISPKMVSYVLLLLVIAAWIMGEKQTAFILTASGLLVLSIWEFLLRRSVWAGLAVSYAVFPFFAMSELRGDTFNGLLVIVLLFFCVWGADIFAYFAGRAIGGPKLAPRISPKKTWAGFIGSLVGALLLSSGVVIWAGYGLNIAFIGIILLVAIVSQIGDLLESSIKRKFDVKDSGKIIPGHGGVLDRVDGLVVAATVLWVILLLYAYNYVDSPYGGNLASGFVDAFLRP